MAPLPNLGTPSDRIRWGRELFRGFCLVDGVSEVHGPVADAGCTRPGTLQTEGIDDVSMGGLFSSMQQWTKNENSGSDSRAATTDDSLEEKTGTEEKARAGPSGHAPGLGIAREMGVLDKPQESRLCSCLHVVSS